jgi:hypothetical protein
MFKAENVQETNHEMLNIPKPVNSINHWKTNQTAPQPLCLED